MDKPVMLFGIHCHQPVDNFYNIVDEAIEKAYKPFIDVVKDYNFKFSVHFSGWLLEYIKEHKKTLFKNLKNLSEKGSIEFFTGGYYEPVLTSIPSDDAKEQIEKLSGFIRDNFRQTPKGLWLTERVYDESIIRDLKTTGVEYIITDDYHFLSAGFEKSELNGYFVTENGGDKLSIYPINKDLRYMIPFSKADDVAKYLKNFKVEDTAIIFDDGEKFGIWPKTYDWVYNRGWLKEFLEHISNNIRTMTFAEHINSFKPKGIAYLPSSSYYEMGEWSLKSKDYFNMQRIREHFSGIERYLRGGIWKNFFVKYEESNRLHKRMLEMSNNKIKKNSARFRENLFKLQCNDVFWHGIFGGLYLPNLRDNAYRFLINCENEIHKSKTAESITADNNFDGYKETKLISPDIIAIFDEKQSGQMVEFDLRNRAFNFQNTLTRRKESYHKKMEKHHEDTDNGGIDTIHTSKNDDMSEWIDKLNYDWYVKNSFIDHITDESINIEDFESCSFKEYGDFANRPFELIGENLLVFERKGGIHLDKKYDTDVRKAFRLRNNILYFNVRINSACEARLNYLLEFNFHFANIKNVKINSQKANSAKQRIEPMKNIEIEDKYTQKTIRIIFEKEAVLMHYPLNTVSQSENGLNYNNQGLTIGVTFPLLNSTDISGYLELTPMKGGCHMRKDKQNKDFQNAVSSMRDMKIPAKKIQQVELDIPISYS